MIYNKKRKILIVILFFIFAKKKRTIIKMLLSPYFVPLDKEEFNFSFYPYYSSLISERVFFFDAHHEPDLSTFKIAILGIPESRNAYKNDSSSLAPDIIREQFYQLYAWKQSVNIIDLGNLIPGKTVEDTYQITASIIAFLIEQNVIPIILGGSNDLAFANYLAYKKLEQVVNIVAVDARFDMGNENLPIASNAYLNRIILDDPCFLLNYSNIGYQTYLNSAEEIELMSKLFLDTYRVGMLRGDLTEVEPIVRNAEMVSLDISAIRRPDACGNPHNSSNGFYGEEICQVARYAGLSDKLTSFGIYEYDPTLDYAHQTSQLIGHILWYLIEGYLYRQDDCSFKNQHLYKKYSVAVSGAIDEIIFYCSKKTGRWWVIVPIINSKKKIKQNYYLPCSLKDYETACKDKIPDRWWKAYHKLNN